MPTFVGIGLLILEKILKDFVKVISLLRNYLQLEKGGVIFLNKLEYYSPNDVLLKLTRWFRRKFLKFQLCIFFILLSPLGKRRSPSFEHT